LLVFNNVFAIWLQLIFIRHTKCETNPVKPDFLHCAAYFKKLFYTLDFILLSWRCCFMYPHLILEGGVWWQHLEIDSVARYLAGSWILPGVYLFLVNIFWHGVFFSALPLLSWLAKHEWSHELRPHRAACPKHQPAIIEARRRGDQEKTDDGNSGNDLFLFAVRLKLI